MLQAVQLLLASRKSIVGLGAVALIGAIYFFGHGASDEREIAMKLVGGIAASLIVAIGAEDAAKKLGGGAS